MTWLKEFLKKIHNFSKGGPLHFLITISSITFDRKFRRDNNSYTMRLSSLRKIDWYTILNKIWLFSHQFDSESLLKNFF